MTYEVSLLMPCHFAESGSGSLCKVVIGDGKHTKVDSLCHLPPSAAFPPTSITGRSVLVLRLAKSCHSDEVISCRPSRLALLLKPQYQDSPRSTLQRCHPKETRDKAPHHREAISKAVERDHGQIQTLSLFQPPTPSARTFRPHMLCSTRSSKRI